VDKDNNERAFAVAAGEGRAPALAPSAREAVAADAPLHVVACRHGDDESTLCTAAARARCGAARAALEEPRWGSAETRASPPPVAGGTHVA
jgi:hypothetical protein